MTLDLSLLPDGGVRWLDAADVRLKQLPLDPAAESAELPLEQPRKVEVSL